MHEIQKLQLEKVLKALVMLDCEYIIYTPDAQEYRKGMASFIAAPTKPVRTKRPRKDYSQFRIPELVATMQVGEVLIFETAHTEFSPAQVMSNVSARGISQFGKGSFTCCTTETQVQAMRTA